MFAAALAFLFPLAALMAPAASQDAAPAKPPPRLALVIGVGTYGKDRDARAKQGFVVPKDLANTLPDADLISKTLKDKGFEVETVSNPDKRTMRVALGNFSKKLAAAGPGAVGLLYYAGHGAQGRPPLERDIDNYLIPADADLITEEDLDSEAVGLRRIAELLKPADKGAVVLILDACRDFALPPANRSGEEHRGLAEAKAKPGTLIAYSTAPGDVAKDGPAGTNSPYARALAHELGEAAATRVEDIFIAVRNSVLAATHDDQQPWENSSLREKITIGDAAPAPQDSPETLAMEAEGLLDAMGYEPKTAGRATAMSRFRAAVRLPASETIDPAMVGIMRVLAQSGHRAEAAVPAPVPADRSAAKRPNVKAEDVILRIDPGMHTAKIGRISVSADGRMLATASEDKTVRLWALPEGRLIRTLRPAIGPGDEGKVYAVALAPDGSWVAAGGWDAAYSKTKEHYVSIFETKTGAVTARLGPLSNVISDLEVSADGRRLAAGLYGQNGIRVWDRAGGSTAVNGASTWRLAFEDKDFGDSVYSLAFARDGRLAAESLDGALRLYDGGGTRLQTRKAPGGWEPSGIAFSPDGTRLAVGYNDTARVDVLDGTSLEPAITPDAKGVDNGDLGCVAWMSDGTLAAAGTYELNGKLPILAWSDGGRGPRRALSGPHNTVMDLVPLGGGLAFGAWDPAFGVQGPEGNLSLVHGPAMADLRGKRAEHFLVSADGRRIRFGLQEWSGSPHLFDVGLAATASPRTGAALAPSPTTSAGLTAADTASLSITDWVNSATPALAGKSLSLETYETSRSLAIAPDKKNFILGTEWYLRRFDATGKALWEKPVPGAVWGVNLARKGRLIVAAYGDGTIRWHRASDGAELLALFIHVDWPGYPDKREPKPLGWVLWTPEGYYTASEGAENLIGWHVNRGLDQAADFYPADTFASTFRRPDLIAKALDKADQN